MADDMGEKTEEPTPRKRNEARSEGNIPKSLDLNAGIILFGGIILLGVFGGQMLRAMSSMVRSMLSLEAGSSVTRTDDLSQAWALGMNFAYEIVTPVVIGLVVIALLNGYFQVGVLFTLKPLQPSLSKISPIKGLARMFSLRSVMRLVMSLGKVGMVMAVATVVIYFDMPKIVSLMNLSAGQVLIAAADIVWWLAVKIAVVLLLLGILDYMYQKWQHEQDLKMTKFEVKQEMKQMDGDPLVKQRRAKVARQLALQRLQQHVPQADVVVTNPTHYAVALKYDGKTMSAPRMVAKGADYMAMRIRQIAVGVGIPIVERPPLARALYREVEPGQEIPADYYAAVAEILAYVYRLNGRQSA